jgi:2-oxoglutarate/2-oxoacid ferredoxin oxidoreductase subunit alpha
MEAIAMKRDDFSWMIGGAQGSGVDTPASIFAKAVATAGFNVYGTREYYSNIKGEHSYFQVRFGRGLLRSHVNTVDMLATFDDETVARHAFEVREDGAIILDQGVAGNRIEDIPTIEPEVAKFLMTGLDKNGFPHTIDGVLEEARKRGVRIYPIQYADILKSVGDRLGETSMTSLTRMTNVLSVAGSFALLSFPKEILAEAIRKQFRSKAKVAAMNVAAVEETYAYVAEHFKGGFGLKFEPAQTNGERRVLVRGTTAVGIGKVAAGCRLQTYYPITPASDESEYLEEHESIDLQGTLGAEAATTSKGSVVVVQTEDETAAILMAIGGGLAGVRASTSTSGPGFCLMAEGMGWAGMNEVPVVVSLYQRAGPSTGLPTRHAQGDLRFALHIGHDEFPRIILASGDIEESFYDVTKAFNFAERYQVPVIHLLDKSMANADQTCVMFDPNQVKIDRGSLIRGQVKGADDKGFKRFAFTQTGISPRPVIGAKGGIFWNSGDEHDEKGHISEDPTNRMMMMEKRMGKLEVAASEIPLDDKMLFHGPKDAPITVVSWGSPKGAILDAMDALREQDGISVNFLQLRLISPFPAEEVKEALSRSKRLVDVEMNYSGQFAGLLREMTGISADYHIVKYNGRPMSCEEIYDALKQISSSPPTKGHAPKRMVLRIGT